MRPILMGRLRGLVFCCVIGGFVLSLDGLARAAPGGRGPQVITFDDVTAPGNPAITLLTSGEFEFSSPRFHTVADPGGGTLPQSENGTIFISQEAGGLGHPITVSRLDGQPFALFGFDGAEAFLNDVEAELEGFPNAAEIRVEAELAAGGRTIATLSLDGLKDGAGGMADFQPFALPSEFCNITSATFFGGTASGGDGAMALDNVRVGAVIPEPSSAIIMLLTATLVFGRRIARRALHNGAT